MEKRSSQQLSTVEISILSSKKEVSSYPISLHFCVYSAHVRRMISFLQGIEQTQSEKMSWRERTCAICAPKKSKTTEPTNYNPTVLNSRLRTFAKSFQENYMKKSQVPKRNFWSVLELRAKWYWIVMWGWAIEDSNRTTQLRRRRIERGEEGKGENGLGTIENGLIAIEWMASIYYSIDLEKRREEKESLLEGSLVREVNTPIQSVFWRNRLSMGINR